LSYFFNKPLTLSGVFIDAVSFGYGGFVFFSPALTLTTASWTGSFITGYGLAFSEVLFGSVTGTATGKRYNILSGSIVDTFGSGSTYFPGDVAGTTATGGQYL
jgi:hypothetical protein